MLNSGLIFLLSCLAYFSVTFSAQANKLEELKIVEARLKADLATEYTKWIAPLYWKPKEVASLNLTRISSWLSTLSDREFTLDERDVLQQIFSQLLVLEQVELPFPKAKLNDLTHFTLARDLENELNHLLRSAFLPSQSFVMIGESGIWQSILQLLPEDEVAPKAQIDRRWRQEVRRYHQKKGYPPVLSQQDRVNLVQKLRNQSPRPSDNEIPSMVKEYEFYGYWGYYSLANAIFRFLQTSQLDVIRSPDSSFYKDLELLHSRLSKDSLLSTLIWELMIDVYPYYSDNRKKRVPLAKPRILRQYFELASQGHFYAIQTLSWLKELDRIFPKVLSDAAFDVQRIDALLSKDRPIFDFFPDVRHYARWNEARTVQKSRYTHLYTNQASLIRRYKGRDQQFGHPEVREYSNLGSIEEAPSFFLDRRDQGRFFSRMKKNSKSHYSDQRYDLDFYSENELNCHVALGDPQRAISLMEEKETPNNQKSRNRARLYKAMLALKSGLSESDLLLGRNESEQIRMACDFQRNQSDKHSIPKQLLDLGLYMEAFEYDEFLKQTEDLYVPLSKQDLIKRFYKGGVLKSIERKMKRDDDLSELDSITDPTIYWPEASELLLNQPQSQNNLGLFSPEEAVLLRLLAETKDDPRTWDAGQYPTEEDIGVRSSLKLFKSVIQTHKKTMWIIPGGVRTTQIAQAYLETGDASRCLDFLANAEKRHRVVLNSVDHALKVRALQALGQDSSAAIAQQTNHERTILLPDLRQAAKLYEDDGDLARAKKALVRACQLSEKLADPGLEEDRTNYKRVLNDLFSSEEFNSAST